VPERFVFDYAVVRVVPRVDRGEFVNAGVIVFSSTASYLNARVELDRARLQALAPSIDAAAVESYLALIPRVCAGGSEAGPIGELPQRARFHWLVAPRSTMIQTSAVHTGRCDDLADALDHLLERMVRPPTISGPSP
jgi:hypothetical protein